MSGPDESAATGPTSSPGRTVFDPGKVELTVLATLPGGSPQVIGMRNDGSSNFVLERTPHEGSHLSFNLKNTDDKPVATLLMVDGINLIRINRDERMDQGTRRTLTRRSGRNLSSSNQAKIIYISSEFGMICWIKRPIGQPESTARASSANRFD